MVRWSILQDKAVKSPKIGLYEDGTQTADVIATLAVPVLNQYGKLKSVQI